MKLFLPSFLSTASSQRPTSSTTVLPFASTTLPSILFLVELPPHAEPSLNEMVACAEDASVVTTRSPTTSRYLVPATRLRTNDEGLRMWNVSELSEKRMQ